MSESETELQIKYPNEERHLEFKRSVCWDGDIRAKIAKSIMALANLRDGGWIVIGKEEQPDRSFRLTGMTQGDYDSFDPDNVKAYMYGQAQPPVIFEVLKKEYDNKKFVLFKVMEFDDVPIVCKRDFGHILHAGSIYVRSKGKPESISVPSDAEMREIIEIAVDKGVSKFVHRLQRTGIWAPKEQTIMGDDEEEYTKQRANLV
ncbi:ATP-binding protein [Candidatus Bathyarchaeota archaeon]|nr:ATP-binding protein [Candidatus Bathyarchaeota archaeon]